ncbi:TRAP transporter small permease [Alteribacillus iranensis]|uniref:TRAP-type C4-dicarboxylate transport system, small permease component n=1 Tax=Alteribacillus iranensis TaxID=930128 RepID=A0A1I2CP17_9BACI|nr:TRAP transporter small permease [Alteribacillus iranensis]SFE70008.1 TRAP-type C4-dicarboxylate transport system, small permease component [Alteribacillus iranensis]
MWKRFITILNKASETISASLLVLMVVLIFMQIVSRGLFGTSYSWTEEISRFSMIWITFLGASIAFQYTAHIGIDYFVKKLPAIPERIVNIIGALICAFFFVVLALKGFELMQGAGSQGSPALRIPMNYVYIIIPVSAVLMLLNLVDVTWKRWKTTTNNEGIME